jgi:hypothetical protein
MELADFKTMNRESLIDWLQTNDRNGIYTDELAKGEGYEPLTRIGALNIINRQLFDDDAEFLDLFEHYDLLPSIPYQIIVDYGECGTYERCIDLLNTMQNLGYTFEYGLDADPHSLREMTAEEKRDLKADNPEPIDEAKAQRKAMFEAHLLLLQDVEKHRPDLFKNRKFIAGFCLANQQDIFYQIAMLRAYKGAELVKELADLITRL